MCGKLNEDYNINVVISKNLEEGKIEFRIFENQSQYGFEDIYVAKVVIDLDECSYFIVFDENIDSETEQELLNVIYKNMIPKLADDQLRKGFGQTRQTIKEDVKDYIRSNQIDCISIKEQELLDNFETELREYHLGYRPENKYFKD